jgi:UDP-3-O-[3-hydroxymyristoyl] glucosamine N-acyltransferase
MSAEIAAPCYIGPNVSIGERCKIAAGCAIHAGSVIGDDVSLGENSVVYGNVSIYDRVRIGARAVLHSGSVIGADGFGFVFDRDHYEKFPQIGTVVIGDDVELGANTCVDRAALGVTRIGDGTKLDNMVHIGHNCEIGRHVVVAAQTGFSGGVVVGDYAVVGGQVGVGDKAKIESKAVVGSGAGILTSKIVRAGDPVWGTPARPLREHLHQLASVARLPQLMEQVKELSRRVDALRGD